MYDIVVPKHDYGYELEFHVLDDDDEAYDLTGYAITFNVWRPGAHKHPILEGTCSTVSALDGTCRYVVVEGDFDVAGDYLCELELTTTGIKESTRNYRMLVEDSP